MKLDLQAAIADLVSSVNEELFAATGNPRKPIADTGDYDELREKAIRDLAQRIGYYGESGPLFDPEGRYRCDDCCLRSEPSACTHVSGKISMENGSCMIWIIGDPINLPAGQKLTQIEANYAERPQGFGCSRCRWGAKAKKADADGRPSWCSWWGMHISPLACCFAEEGAGMKVAPGE